MNQPWVYQFSSVQLLSCARLFATPHAAACQASVSINNGWSLPKPMSIESDIQTSPPLLSSSALSLSLNQGLFKWIRWPKYWRFSFKISPSNEHPGLISFGMDWLGLLAVQGTLKSLLQRHSLKSFILGSSAFFIVELSYPYMTMGKTISLTRWTFVDEVMSLRFNILSRLVITFFPRCKCLIISWLQSPSAMILDPLPPLKVWRQPLFPHLFAMKWWDWMPLS